MGRWPESALSLLLAAVLMLGAGCTRNFYRQKADCEVSEVLSEKDVYPRWKIENSHVYPDPRSRFADPTNPDRPPMPPDDPAAMDLSPNPQRPGKAGVGRVEGTGYLNLLAYWDEANRAPDPEKKQPESIIAREEAAAVGGGATGRIFRIKLEQAAELGLINSREYQSQREDLYIAALPVTLERFAFTAQFFAMTEIIREWTGRDTPEGRHNRWRANSKVGFTKLFSTGALLLFRIANQTVIELTGPLRGTTSQSTLSLDFIQPLLRGAGQAVTLEPLTQVERDLVYMIRNYARFREIFFVAVAGGPDTTFGGGLTFGNTIGLLAGPGGSGLVPGSFTVAGADIGHALLTPISAGIFNLATGVAARNQGYLPTLLLAARLVDQRRNVATLEDFLQRFQAFKEGGDVSQLQVDQVEDQMLQGRIAVLQRLEDFRAALDQFKLQLGLPANVPLELDDAPVMEITEQLQRYEKVIDQFKAVQDQALALDVPDNIAGLRADLRRLITTSPVVEGTRFQTRVPVRWKAWERLSDRERDILLRQLGAERRTLLAKKTELEHKNQTLGAAEAARLAVLDFEIGLGTLDKDLHGYEGQPWKQILDPERRERQRTSLFRDVINDFLQLLGEARNERLEHIRQGWPKLPLLCVSGTDLLQAELDRAETLVTQTALINRFDLMNERALLVDSWRQIAVFANALLGSVNVEYHLDSFTPAGQAKPFAFGGSRTRNQLILNADAPLVRQAERNNYRASLIAYQRRRRALMAAEDVVAATVRQEIRQLRQLAENYRIQQRSMELAYLNVEDALDTFYAPPAPSAGPATGSTAGNAAALTQQLLAAQSRVPSAQDQLYTTWVTYQTVRLQLYRDLEMMPLDFRGVWIDDIATCQCGPAESNESSGAGGKQPESERKSRDGENHERPEELPKPDRLPSP